MVKNIIKVKENALFKGLSNEEFNKIFSNIAYSNLSYNKGQILFQEGEICKDIGLIVDGCINIERIYENGKTITLKKLFEGDVFGEALIFSNQGLYPATIIAESNCRVVFINKKEIMMICSSNEIVLENFITLLSDKVVMLNRKVRNISLKSVNHKVVDYILERSKESDSDTVVLNGSKEEVANDIGIPRPSLSRELINLRNENIIEFDRKKIYILDRERLEEKLFD